MEDFILSNPERIMVFKLLCEEKRLHFNEICRRTGLQSNKLSYQLNLMKEKGFLVNEEEGYGLSLEAQRLIPYFSQIFKKEVGVLPAVLGIVRHENKILLLKRKKMPYKGKWGLIGGKQINGETIAETIEREVREETTLDATFERCNAVVYERLKEDGNWKHSFLLIITTLRAASAAAREQEEGPVAWFDYDEIVEGKVPDVIPTDREFVKNYAEQTVVIDHLVMEEENEKITLK